MAMPGKDEKAKAAGRRQLLLIVAVFVVPVLVASGWYFIAPRLAPTAPSNGTLITPARPLESFTVTRPDTDPYTLSDLRGHWSMVLPLGSSCGQTCQQRLYDTRQIHDALGEDRIRVRRIVLASDGRRTQGLSALLEQHPRLTVLEQPSDGPLARQFPEAAAGTVFLVDPHGNLMMRFAPDVEADGMLDDLEHLLKVSRIG